MMSDYLSDCQSVNYDFSGMDLSTCVALSAYLAASSAENKRGDPKNTLDIYKRGFLAIVNKKKQAILPLLDFDLSLTSRNLCGAIVMSGELGDKEQVKSLLRTADTTFSNEEQYILNKNCLFFADIIYIGNYEDLLQRTIRAIQQLNVKHDDLSLSSLNPFLQLNDWSDMQVVEAFEAWALFQTGKEEKFRRMFEDKEGFLQSGLASFLLWGSRTTGVLAGERRMLQAIAGYGYGLLGKHESARKHLEGALSSGGSCDGDQKYLYWGIRAVFVDAVSLPYEDYNRGRRLLEESETCLKQEQSVPEFFRSPYPDIFSGYPTLLAAKLSFQEKDFPSALANLSRAWSLMGGRTPRQLQIDTIYYWGQSCLKAQQYCDVDRFAHAIASTEKRISLFDGYELWKFWIAKAYLAQLRGRHTEALSSLNTAVTYTQRITAPGWIQQYTFMEDKWRPYVERIKVANFLHAQGNLPTDSVFRIRSEYKARVASINAPPLYSPKVMSLATFQNQLPDSSVAIDIFYDYDNMSVLEVQKNKATLREISIPQNEIETAISNINSHFMEAVPPITESRFTWSLLGLTEFGKTRNAMLFVSPHRRFYYLPWNVVSFAANDSTLNVQTTVLPLGLGVEFDSRRLNTPRKEAIVFGDIDDIGNFSSFDYSPPNFKRVILKGSNSTRENVKLLLADSSLMIFFAHGDFEKGSVDSENLQSSGIRLGNGDIFSLKDLSQITEINARTVYLESCKAGIMPNPYDLPGDVLNRRFPEATDVLSFYHLLLSRGVNTVIMGTNDIKPTTDELVDHFLQFTATREEEDSAFYRAQKLMMQSGRPIKQWAGLVTVKSGIKE